MATKTPTSRVIALAKGLPIPERRRLLAAVRRSLNAAPGGRPSPRRKPSSRPARGREPYAALLALAGTITGQPADISSRVDEYLAQAALGGR